MVICMFVILAKGGCEREREQWRHDQSERAGEQVPIASCPPVRHATSLKSARPPADRGEPDDVEHGSQRDDPDRERTDALAIAKRDRATGWAWRRQLETDDGRGRDEDHGAPGEVRDDGPAQRRASSLLRRDAASASRRAMRRNS